LNQYEFDVCTATSNRTRCTRLVKLATTFRRIVSTIPSCPMIRSLAATIARQHPAASAIAL
jgi:hypothetical protein